MSRYLRRSDFPARRSPPWDLADLAAVCRWRAEELQENRNWNTPTAALDEIDVALGGARITAELLLCDDPPFDILKAWFGKLWPEQTTADLDSLADHLNTATLLIMAEREEREGREMLGSGTATYYRGILDNVSPERLSSAWNRTTYGWTCCRYSGDGRKWWRLLSDPPADKQMTPKFLKQFEPLKHRNQTAGTVRQKESKSSVFPSQQPRSLAGYNSDSATSAAAARTAIGTLLQMGGPIPLAKEIAARLKANGGNI